MVGKEPSGDAGAGDHPYVHIESLLRALHQPNVNVARPAEHAPPLLDNIEEQAEEVPETPEARVRRLPPVLFDIESASETSSNPPSPLPSEANLVAAASGSAVKEKSSNQREQNLEQFNKNVLNVMDTLMKSRDEPSTSLKPSASTGRPFAFYQRIHRHNSAHSLNIPNIVVTGSGDHHHSGHHHKKFSFGLRRHSHAVVGHAPTDSWLTEVVVGLRLNLRVIL